MGDSQDALLSEFVSTNPSSEEDVLAAEKAFGVTLPQDYRSFLLGRGGGEGFLGEQYLILWNADQIVPYNADYEAETYAPGLLIFGSSGGGEGFAFDLRKQCNDIVAVPFIGMSLKDAKSIAPSFTDFLEKLSQPDAELF
ncbi:SMI1 / KNR4 family protein [Pirellulimonas nuda]|uniref:SMI1 / KNR4 family protein n=1 Tax=Pirellulimonas nuda TaxID=2528009 RepID=A0A518DHF7_9BACT|nr:SMI1/KNR4 family protein [Pirellulimonas nuda]QDU90910.1 SMI1 / KNR4 family protein [Pirellulimonas nuda]